MYFFKFFGEVDQIHPFTSSFCHCFRNSFASVLPNVLKLEEGKSPLAKQCTDARQDAMAEDLPGSGSSFDNVCDSWCATITLENVAHSKMYPILKVVYFLYCRNCFQGWAYPVAIPLQRKDQTLHFCGRSKHLDCFIILINGPDMNTCTEKDFLDSGITSCDMLDFRRLWLYSNFVCMFFKSVKQAFVYREFSI